MLFFIDFWPRYMVPLVPVFILLTVYVFKTKKVILFILLFLYIPSIFLLFFPSPNTFINNFSEKINQGFYKETYKMLSKQTKDNISEKDWKKLSEKIYTAKPIKEGNLWKLTISLPQSSPITK